jgi:hypothetical protein
MVTTHFRVALKTLLDYRVERIVPKLTIGGIYLLG